jgi:single-stranded-DNA-specific exonuclease
MRARRIVRRMPDPARLAALPGHLHPVLRRVYAGRGISEPGELALGLDCLMPVGSLEGVQPAAELLAGCHSRGERVLVLGDFDADGATSTALLIRQLRRLGFADPLYLVPDRFKFGYGLSPEIVRVAAQRQPALIVTVDNGISSLEGVAEARRLGIEVLVTDHHLPGAELPEAAVIVNPNLRGSRFGSRALAGVGVAFYLAAGLTRELRERGLVPSGAELSPAELLDLVALGTVADVVPLDQNNRILVAQGLRRIRAGRCVPGIRALLEIAGRRLEDVIAQDLAFQVGPRLNAAGRLEDMSLGIECLLADDPARAASLAAQLASLNAERREIEAQMQREALDQLEIQAPAALSELPPGVCVFDAGWHQGVIGLVASRLKERLHRPVVAFAPGDPGWLKGSARSVPGVHVRDVLDAVAKRTPGLLERFGGHAMAAGMTLDASRLAEFQQAFAVEVARWVDADTLAGDLHTDGALGPGELVLETALALREGGPWGAAFPEPSFDGSFGVIDARIVGGRHLKLRLREEGGEPVDAIAFRYSDDPAAAPVQPGDSLEMVYRVTADEYAGRRRLQLVSEWLAPSPAA